MLDDVELLYDRTNNRATAVDVGGIRYFSPNYDAKDDSELERNIAIAADVMARFFPSQSYSSIGARVRAIMESEGIDGLSLLPDEYRAADNIQAQKLLE